MLRISPSFQRSINNRLEFELSGETVGQCIEHGKNNFAELKELLFKDNKLNPQILLFHNNTLIREDNFSTKVFNRDVLDIIPAIEAG